MNKITVTSAGPLSDTQKETLEHKFAVKYGDFTVKYVINDAIISGIIVFDGEKVFDGSVSGRLERLRESLKDMKNE